MGSRTFIPFDKIENTIPTAKEMTFNHFVVGVIVDKTKLLQTKKDGKPFLKWTLSDL